MVCLSFFGSQCPGYGPVGISGLVVVCVLVPLVALWRHQSALSVLVLCVGHFSSLSPRWTVPVPAKVPWATLAPPSPTRLGNKEKGKVGTKRKNTPRCSVAHLPVGHSRWDTQHCLALVMSGSGQKLAEAASWTRNHPPSLLRQEASIYPSITSMSY